jgi:hypothetical protein
MIRGGDFFEVLARLVLLGADHRWRHDVAGSSVVGSEHQLPGDLCLGINVAA